MAEGQGDESALRFAAAAAAIKCTRHGGMLGAPRRHARCAGAGRGAGPARRGGLTFTRTSPEDRVTRRLAWARGHHHKAARGPR
ncbi:MAG: hypothetical protein ACKO6D_03495 [Rubrivivax sp.]